MSAASAKNVERLNGIQKMTDGQPWVHEWTFIHWPMVSIHPVRKTEWVLTHARLPNTGWTFNQKTEWTSNFLNGRAKHFFRWTGRLTDRGCKGHAKAGVTGNNPSSPPVEFSDSFLLKPLSPKPKQASKQKWVFGDVSIFDTGVCEGKKRFLFTPASTAGQIYPQATMQHPCQKL